MPRSHGVRLFKSDILECIEFVSGVVGFCENYSDCDHSLMMVILYTELMLEGVRYET